MNFVALSTVAVVLSLPAAAFAVEALPPPTAPGASQVAPGISYEEQSSEEFGDVHIIRSKPSGLTSLAPILASGSPARTGSLAAAVAERPAAVAAVNGDFFNTSAAYPSGLTVVGGQLLSEPEPSRSALVFGSDGILSAARLTLAGKWQGVDPAGLIVFSPRTFSAINRPSERSSETIVYTPAFGASSPEGKGRTEVQIRLDNGGTIGPNQPVEGVVTVQSTSGATALPAGHVVLTGVGTAGGTIARDLVLGTRVRLEATIAGFPVGANAVGGGPLLVDAESAVSDAGEGFTSGQITQRTSRTAVGQAADGSMLLVTVEGSGQGRRGVTVAEQATLMKRLGARIAVAMDAGGSAQMIAGGQPTIFWASPRSITSAVALSYAGVRIAPLPFRLTPNTDGIDDSTTSVVTAPVPGRLIVRLQKRGGATTRELVNEPVPAGPRPVTVDPRALKVGDGPFRLVSEFTPDQGAATTAERELLIDRTLGFLNVRAFSRKVGRARKPALGISFRLIRPARATVRIVDAAGVVRKTLVSGKRYAPGLVVLEWNRRLGKESATGTFRVEVEAATGFGTPGLAESVALKPPPKPSPRPPRP